MSTAVHEPHVGPWTEAEYFALGEFEAVNVRLDADRIVNPDLVVAETATRERSSRRPRSFSWARLPFAFRIAVDGLPS
jgi:hypothetical protein